MPKDNERGSGFAASTLAATAWLIAFAPERLAAWVDRHPRGEAMEAETRRLIAVKAERKAKQRSATVPA